ncbi:MAG: FAD-dependent oxidoreductase, partial [Wenzhouxiangella sp.]|nr:FAD-dependent oxidoreductase [Wenzhouxiangella sp.]
MKLAVVGGGVSGLYAAWHLSKQHEVIVLEADRRLGGHADTHQVQEQGRTIAVDSGFIVFNEVHYPLFAAWLQALGISWHDSDMSFSVSDSASGLEYNATNLDRLFCQRRNLL